ncbi:tripartite tricarboxylate transporter substrate binding protein [Paeniroseomonas aquatica]|uniref:Tripartite tricarboxylate transporter substrate binding protein n=2 Tax=Paeniroseomonas aquatica TaxID=373043 RepID=A0ABT8A3C9_9PROT|nr:tripartite tricarboxylate transporter substrate binding protein [Paeniroseomonas aquatica]MDN3564028.1 tripartite tricarboxylate transporter substrate binding protein [Paeniroseomonas aquatica]
MMLTRRSLAAAALLPVAAHAQGAWPDRPVRLLVGFPAGGPTDFAARILQDPLQQLWGQPLVIENRPGASQMIAAEAVVKSPPDGYTLMLCTSNLTTNPAVFSRLPYDTIRDFTPIVVIYSSPTVLFTGPDQPYRTVRDVVEAAKRRPGMAAASSGVATSGHFATEMFMRAAGVELTHVPYRGAMPAVQDVIGGRVPITFSTLSGVIALARDGKLRPLAIAAPRRSKVFPEVPTMAEAGFPIRDTSPWYSFVAPAGLPTPLLDRIVADVQGLLQRPDVIARIEESGGVVEGEGPAAFRARIPREIAINTEVARAANIHIE